MINNSSPYTFISIFAHFMSFSISQAWFSYACASNLRWVHKINVCQLWPVLLVHSNWTMINILAYSLNVLCERFTLVRPTAVVKIGLKIKHTLRFAMYHYYISNRWSTHGKAFMNNWLKQKKETALSESKST